MPQDVKSQTMKMKKCPWVKVVLVQTIRLFPDFLQLCLVALETPKTGISAKEAFQQKVPVFEKEIHMQNLHCKCISAKVL